jgi:serine/threonine protein kinase/Flp pilus assembly protein TadD
MTDVLRDQLQTALGGTFTVERELGGGGMSRVFVAYDMTLGRRVVVKSLSPDLAATVSAERFRREIRLAASLQQANIVPVHSAGEMGGVPYYTMPFVEGESLRAYLAVRGALPIREAVGILRDVARALAFAHERGVVHRDIKPENVLLSGTTAVVTDFGIAKALEASRTSPDAPTITQLGTAVGTPAYIAPEQASGDPSVDHRADIYALGVLAYELLTSEPPFTSRRAQALLAAHISQQPVDVAQRRRDVPRDLATLVMRCLEKDPTRRPQSAREVLDALESASLATPPNAARFLRGAAQPKPSVAVLPFANLSPSGDEYFSDGITEDIIAQLSQVASLKVISRTSVMRYKKTEKSAKDIALELGVSHIVAGSVRRAANRLRIVAQVIDAESDAHLWAETFDRDLTDVFAIQTEVAERIAGALRARLLPDERSRIARRPTGDLEAYNLYLRGRHHFNQAGPDAFAKAIDCYTRATERDPSFARAYAAQAMVYMYFGAGYWGMKPREAWAQATLLAEQALALDPELSEAHHVLGEFEHWVRYDWSAAKVRLERAIELNPSFAFHYIGYAVHLATVGRLAEAVDAVLRAVDLDPAAPIIRGNSVFFHYVARRYDEALAEARAAQEYFPDEPFLRFGRACILIALGRADEAVAPLRELAERVPITWTSLILAWGLAAAGQAAEARRLLSDIHSRETTEYVWPTALAFAYAHLGEMDRAFEYLERAYDDRAGWMQWIACMPAFDPFRGDARFEALVRRVGAIPPAS